MSFLVIFCVVFCLLLKVNDDVCDIIRIFLIWVRLLRIFLVMFVLRNWLLGVGFIFMKGSIVIDGWGWGLFVIKNNVISVIRIIFVNNDSIVKCWFLWFGVIGLLVGKVVFKWVELIW